MNTQYHDLNTFLLSAMQDKILIPDNTTIPISNNRYLDNDGYTNIPVSIVDETHSDANTIQAEYFTIRLTDISCMDIIFENQNCRFILGIIRILLFTAQDGVSIATIPPQHYTSYRLRTAQV